MQFVGFSFKLGMVITTISIIMPVVFAILAFVKIKKGNSVRLLLDDALPYLDALLFSSHALLLGFGTRWMSVPVAFPIMLLNIMVSSRYVARIIDVAYSNCLNHRKISNALLDPKDNSVERSFEGYKHAFCQVVTALAPGFTSEKIWHTSIYHPTS